MKALFYTYLYNPTLQLLEFIYDKIAFHDLGIAIVIITVLIRVVLYPLFYKGAKDQALMQKIQPKIKKAQEEYKNNKEEQVKVIMGLYKEHKLNPFSGVLILIIQIPIIIALYQVFLNGLSPEVFDNQTFLGLIDLREKSIIIAIVAAGLQYIQGKLSMAKNTAAGDKDNPLNSVGKMMVGIGPLLTLVILVNLPSAIGIYWIVSTLFSIGQQVIVNKKVLGKTNITNNNGGNNTTTT